MDRYAYYLGLDLGQKLDYTALALLEEPVWVPDDLELRARYNAPPVGWVSPAELTQHQLRGLHAVGLRARPERPALALRHLHRYALGTPYPAIVGDVVALLGRPPLSVHPTALLVDATGVGGPVVDLFKQAGARPYAVTITGGTQVIRTSDEIHVPKRDLVSAVAVLLETRRLKIAEELPEAATLVKELGAFQRTVTRVGRDAYETPWREGQHDDLVLAVALAGWFREWWNVHLDRAGSSAVYCRHGVRVASSDGRARDCPQCAGRGW